MHHSMKNLFYIGIFFQYLLSCADGTMNDSDEVIMLNINPYAAGMDTLPSPSGGIPSPTNGGTDNQAGTIPINMMAGMDMMAGNDVMDVMEPMAGTQVVPDPPSNEFPDFAVEMLGYVNQFRSTGGTCGSQSFPSSTPLILNALLNQAAQAHADDMGRNNYFDHNSQDGRSPWERISATGYQGNGFGENIAAGRGDAQSTFTQWQNSPGHCRNMLSSNYNELGVGYTNAPASQYRHYWVQNFARSR